MLTGLHNITNLPAVGNFRLVSAEEWERRGHSRAKANRKVQELHMQLDEKVGEEHHGRH